MQFLYTNEWIFSPSPHTGELKTQTRRVVKPGEYITFWGDVYNREKNHRLIYGKGTTRAVQPGRTQKAVGRIKILAIRREDVQNISDADVRAEGFASREDYLTLWRKMHVEDYMAWVLTFEVVK